MFITMGGATVAVFGAYVLLCGLLRQEVVRAAQGLAVAALGAGFYFGLLEPILNQLLKPVLG
ncbi:hypothetical protein [Kitasatospora sp. LaBMicrA B282]|uniref:hypothetical protein n=1 Tax=Kitasatospora sp. LaBMicrA B282 TaxID=3420949 RepID=UPI003D10146C